MTNFKFTLPNQDQYLNIPVEIKWDFYGQEDGITEYTESVLKDVIGVAEDFEVARFSHLPYNNNTKTDIKYDFHFFNNTDINTATSNDWVISYIPEGFTPQEVYYYSKPFTKSFFKLDFYDTNEPTTQTNYFTIIVPVQQGGSEVVSISPLTPNVKIRVPSFTLDFVGDKEGFFVYWLRNTQFLNIDTFYMTAKFFDGREGVFIKMMNTPQSNIPSNKFGFDGSKYFYYKLKLNYQTKTYQVFNNLDVRVGTTQPIKWYEYVNP